MRRSPRCSVDRRLRKPPLVNPRLLLLELGNKNVSMRSCGLLLVLASAPWALAGCGLYSNDPRAALAKIGVPYSADALVAQAGEGDLRAVQLLLESGIAPDV